MTIPAAAHGMRDGSLDAFVALHYDVSVAFLSVRCRQRTLHFGC